MLRRPISAGFFLLAFAFAAGCGGAQKPSEGPADTEQVAGLEQRVEELERRLDRMEARGHIGGAVATDLGSLESRVSELEKNKAGAAPRPRRPRRRPKRPDPSAVYAVPILGNPYVGPKHAWVTVIKGFEFACPFCERTRPTLAQLKKEYGKDLKIVYKHFIVHPSTAEVPARAACAAQQQGAFKKMYELIWDKGFKSGRDLSRANMLRLARRLKLKIGKFKKDMDGPCTKLVRSDQAELTRVGTRGTPAFFINGRFLSGAQPIDRFRTLIDEELKKAKASGKKVDEYYDHILESGLKELE